MANPRWMLVVFGIVSVLIGLLWVALPSIPWLGRLRGDIRIEGESGSFYFPLPTVCADRRTSIGHMGHPVVTSLMNLSRRVDLI